MSPRHHVRPLPVHANRRPGKTDLLPLPPRIRDTLSLEYHLLLEALKAGAGRLEALQILTRVALATTMLAKDGYGDPCAAGFDELESAAYDAYLAGEQAGMFGFEDDTFQLFARVLTLHDQQLRVTPVSAIDRLAQRLEGRRAAA